MNRGLEEDFKRGGYVSEIIRRLRWTEETARELLGLKNHSHQVSQCLPWFLQDVTVPAGTTQYLIPGLQTLYASNLGVTWPRIGTAKNMRFRLGTAQPASGNMVITFQVALVGTALSVTIPAGAAGGTLYSNITNFIDFTQFNNLNISVQNNALAASGGLRSLTLEFITRY